MASTILRNSLLKLQFNTPVPLTTVDLSCYAIAMEITPSTEEIDIGTFCAPSASALGRTTYTALASLLWEPALYTALNSHINELGVAAFAPDATKPLEYVKFDTRYAAQPWGRFEVGQRVEVELPLAVLTTPAWFVGTLLRDRLDEPEWDSKPVELPEGKPVEPDEPEVSPAAEPEA